MIDFVTEVILKEEYTRSQVCHLLRNDSVSVTDLSCCVCSMRQRPELVSSIQHDMNYISPPDEIGWKDNNQFMESGTYCTSTHKTDKDKNIKTIFYAMYSCTAVPIKLYSWQSEVAITEDISLEVESMNKLYIVNTPGIAEAYESTRIPLWKRLINDQSLFTDVRSYFCTIMMFPKSSLYISSQGGFIESLQSLEMGMPRNNSVMIGNWLQHGKRFVNSVFYMEAESNKTLKLHYARGSEDHKVAFAIPITGLNFF